MDENMTIAITGATGALGGIVAELLSDTGLSLRLIVRDPSRAPALPDAVVAVASYDDRGASLEALRGITTLFMVSAKESPDRLLQHRIFIEAARDAGVQHMVYTSFAGAAPDATFTFARDHFETEIYLQNSGMDYTILRDNFYMDVTPYFPGTDGVIRGPAGTGRAATVARADVAAAATAVLRAPDAHVNRIYEMTGPEALSLIDVAHMLSKALSRNITFQSESIEEAYKSRAHYGAEAWEVDAWVSTYTAIAADEMSTVSRDVEILTGRPPRSLAELLSGTNQGINS
ncbi:MAG: NAD(P)-dependent oxidoreductase [Frondihabitans sp.]|nr:NAD(P)-dependent oxidoreductase [Frondihabitans sp.]